MVGMDRADAVKALHRSAISVKRAGFPNHLASRYAKDSASRFDSASLIKLLHRVSESAP
jgi:hypothetical protein